MAIIDVDTHFMEPWDWLERDFPELGERLPKWNFVQFLGDAFGGEALAALPSQFRPDPLELVPRPLIPFCEALGREPKSGRQLAADMERLDEQSPAREHLRQQPAGRVPHQHGFLVQRLDDLGRVIGDLLQGLLGEHVRIRPS
ncbi:MAG: hypothetical protein ABW110_07490, partial [Steroidobacteraceae bacterium]